jgi:hypothetical protein
MRAASIAAEIEAYVAHALHGDGLPLQRFGAPAMLRAGLNGAEDAARRHRRGIARAVGQPGDELRLHVHEIHVGGTGADVFGRHVAAA